MRPAAAAGASASSSCGGMDKRARGGKMAPDDVLRSDDLTSAGPDRLVRDLDDDMSPEATVAAGVVEVAMPRLSDGMEEGTIVTWLKQPGDLVSRGDELVEIETDKATVTHPADGDGVLEIVVEAGGTAPVGAVIARLLGSADQLGTAGDPAPAVVPEARPPEAVSPPVTPSAVAGEGSSRITASPLARRIARERGLDLAAIAGTGPRGRIVRSDVEAAGHAAAPAPAPATADRTGADVTTRGEVSVHAPTRTQALIARRMAEAKSTVPEFTVSVEVDAEPALAAREALRDRVDPLPSVNDIIIKACAQALRDHPHVNAAYRDGAFERYSRINVGMAVAGAGTLVVPTVFDADRMRLTEIARTTRELAARVRDGTVAPAELEGGTFTVSNLGMFGVATFVAVINAPQAAILGVGAALPRAVLADDGSLVRRRIMELTLTADHRILYGADAAGFLNTVRDLLEAPFLLLA
jgi:pyruvate dehydrogenase E2 component (dihydrolipoamide acetyltransferase)